MVFDIIPEGDDAGATQILEEAIGLERSAWSGNCHTVSLAIVQSGLLGECRVARGSTRGVASQHSWVVMGDDCYDLDATILDATLWSYVDGVPTVLVARAKDRPHTPKGSGNIMAWGQPQRGDGPTIDLEPSQEMSSEAKFWLENMLGPLDLQGWMALASAPVGGWPSEEIFSAMDDTPSLANLVPMDVMGMLTDRNPGGLYR